MPDYISLLTKPDVQQFICGEELIDIRKLVLRHKEIMGVPSSWIAAQISGRRKAKEKLPSWYRTPGIIYPPSLNLEQCSSEATARYKKNMLNGTRFADLTGGFGVDSFFFAQSFTHLDYIEPDEELAHLVEHNHRLLGAKNIRYHRELAEQFIASNEEPFDALYVDPSRRIASRKVFLLSEAAPDVVALQGKLLEKASRVIIKASPRLDLKQAFRELPSIDQFTVLAHENECKEVLLELHRSTERDEPVIKAVNIEKDGTTTTLAFTWTEEKAATVTLGEPGEYLYEPNPAIMKSGAFRLIGQHYGLKKLATDTHLYTADKQLEGFPGRVFRVLEHVRVGRGLCKKFEGGQANILVRNFPQTVEQVKKQTGLTEGGTDYLVCTRASKLIALVARRI